jgi:hypothetical protein
MSERDEKRRSDPTRVAATTAARSAESTHRAPPPPVVPREQLDRVGSDGSPDDVRYAKAWRVWLAALAHDPEAAWAAALTYRSLDSEGREAWLDALDVDAPDVSAPAIALYAPILAVEDDDGRRARIEATLLRHGAPAPTEELRGLRGVDDTGARRVIVLVHPLYLDFVEVLTCALDAERGFADVRHDPIGLAEKAPRPGDVVDGVELEAVPVEPLIEELAHAVVAHRRRNDEVPAALARFVDLFTPRPESVDLGRVG